MTIKLFVDNIIIVSLIIDWFLYFVLLNSYLSVLAIISREKKNFIYKLVRYT